MEISTPMPTQNSLITPASRVTESNPTKTRAAMNTATISTKHIILSLLFITTFFSPTSTQETLPSTDTLNTSQTLTDNGEKLTSSGGSFELGFFSPENSPNRYIGIWYKNVTLTTVVWVANRASPLTNTSGTLTVVDPGLLILLNQTNGTIWSTNTSRTVRNPVAQLLDTGNLIIRDAADDPAQKPLWQSFDYPTDTQLPGMKVGWDFVTGHEIYLSSWKSSSDPSIGDYTYHCDPSGYPQIIMKQGNAVVYRTGPWNGIGVSGVPNLRQNPIFSYGFVMNKNEVYYHYDLIHKSVISRFTLMSSGVGQRSNWVDRTQNWETYLTAPTDTCDIYEACGPYGSCNIENTPVCGCLENFEPKDWDGWGKGDWSKGCVRRRELNCVAGDGFLKYSGVKVPDTRNSWYNVSMSLEECEMMCLKNCSCMAYGNLDISRGGNGCLLWFGDLVDIKKLSPGQDIYIRMASSKLDSGGTTRKILTVALSVVIGIFLVSLSLLLYFKKRKKLDHQKLQETGMVRLNYTDDHPDPSHDKELELPHIDLPTIVKATDNFSIDNKLGEGGFGPVYKGLLEEGQEVAVKRLSTTSLQGGNEFKNEVNCIAKLQHRNLVKLLGCCIQGEEKMLVYEYMTNKSLDLILFDQEKRMLLDWPKRFSIINGIARGVMYLHQDSRLRVIHRDLKASNVLLDSEMNPKISDFGLARTFGGNETGANTSRVVGTYGYMSPEYAVDGIFSVKSDVFSFGVLVLEIVSGYRNRGFSHTDHNLNLLGHAWMLYKEERSLELVDSCIADSSYSAEVLRSIHVGLLCVQEKAEDRPNISSVVMMLTNESVLPQAKYPGFFMGRDVMRMASLVSSDATNSGNEMTITLLQAR